MDNKELKDKIKFKIIMSEIDNEERKKYKKIKIIKNIAAVACFVFCICGITFADAISEKIYDIYNFRKQYTIEIKLPEEVVNDEQKLEEVLNNKNSIIKWDENAADIIESNNVEIDITEVAMDDYYMSFYADINFSTDVTDKMKLEDIYLVRFPDLVIKDENDNILFCMEENKLKEIFKTDNLNIIRNNPKYCISEVTRYGFDGYDKLGTNPYKTYFHLNTRQPSIYPKSKKLIFEFTKIALDAPEASIGIDDKHYLHQDQRLTVVGNWKIEVDVPSKYYKRENVISYKEIEKNLNSKNELLYCYYEDGLMHALFYLESEQRRTGPWGSAKLGDMLAGFEIEPTVRNYITYKICTSDEFKKMEAWQEEIYYIEDYYIENSKGEKSKEAGLLKLIENKMVSVSKTRWSGGTYVKNGILRDSNTPGKDENGKWYSPHGVEFDIDKDKLTDEMTIKIRYLGRNIEFKLEKMKGDE